MLLEHLQERTWRESDAVPVALSNSQPHQVWDSARYEITWTNLFYGTSSWRDGSSFSIQVQMLFLTSEADVACCKEHQLSAVFQKKSPPSSRHTGTFLLSYFPTSFQQLLWLYKPHPIFSEPLGKHLSATFGACFLVCLLFQVNSQLLLDIYEDELLPQALPLCLPTLLIFLPAIHA